MHLLPTLTMALAAAWPITHAQTRPPVTITAQQVVVAQPQGLATFSGNVRAEQGALTLTTPQLQVTYGTGAGTEDGLRQLTATGTAQTPVRFTRSVATGAPEEAEGAKAVYTPADETLVLTGNVRLTRQGSTLTGQNLTYHLPSGRVTVTGGGAPVRAVIQQQAQQTNSPTAP